MTKLELNLNTKEKPEEGVKTEQVEMEVNGAAPTDVDTGAKEDLVDINEILRSVGLEGNEDTVENVLPPCPPEPIGMDWDYIRRVANTQLVLATITVSCLSLGMLAGGMNVYNFTPAVWALYLLTTAYTGHRAGRIKSYAHGVAFCAMTAFQTLVHLSTMCWLVYVVYCLDTHARKTKHTNAPFSDVVLLLTLGEVLALMGTVITGVFALVGCCKGFGRLMQKYETFLKEQEEMKQSMINESIRY